MRARLRIVLVGACALALAAPLASSGLSTSAPRARSAATCSKEAGHRVALAQFKHVDQVAEALCGALLGPGSQAMVVAFTPGTCGINGWALFSFSGGRWRLVGARHVGWVDALKLVGSDLKETLPIPTGIFHCPTSDPSHSRIWHWNGTHFSPSAWTPEAGSSKQTLHLSSFRSPSGNLSCDIEDEDQAYCSSLKHPHVAILHRDGTLHICNGGKCLGPGGGAGAATNTPPVLGYGQQTEAAGYRCGSETNGITCTEILPGKGFGKGFLINAAAVRPLP